MRYKSYWIHTECEGIVDIRKRTCTKCNKTWSRKDLLLDPTGLRIVKEIVKETPTSYANWADRIPYVSLIASKLPDWPRWARIVSTLFVYSLAGYLLWSIVFGGLCR